MWRRGTFRRSRRGPLPGVSVYFNNIRGSDSMTRILRMMRPFGMTSKSAARTVKLLAYQRISQISIPFGQCAIKAQHSVVLIKKTASVSADPFILLLNRRILNCQKKHLTRQALETNGPLTPSVPKLRRFGRCPVDHHVSGPLRHVRTPILSTSSLGCYLDSSFSGRTIFTARHNFPIRGSTFSNSPNHCF